MASPSALTCRSASMAYRPAIAASAADAVFSTIPARGRVPAQASKSAPHSPPARRRSRDFERSLNLDRCVARQRRNANGGAGVAAFFAEYGHHEVRCAVHHLGAVQEVRRRIDKAAQPHDADHLVEIAERRLDLRQQVDRAGPGGGLSLLDRDLRAKLAGGNQGAASVAQLAGYEQQASAAHKTHIIGNGRRRNRQFDPQFLKLFVNGSRHAPTAPLIATWRTFAHRGTRCKPPPSPRLP